MQLFATTHNYPYSFDQVTAAHWQKYPNPLTRHVLHVDTIHREVDPKSGNLITKRLIVCRQKMPTLLRKWFGQGELMYALETSVTDPVARTLVARTVNLSYTNLMACHETMTLTDPSPQKNIEKVQLSSSFPKRSTTTNINSTSHVSPSITSFSSSSDQIESNTELKCTILASSEVYTIFKQEARISAAGVLSRVAGMVEDAGVKRFKENALIGRQGLESVLERLKNDAVEFRERVCV